MKTKAHKLKPKGLKTEDRTFCIRASRGFGCVSSKQVHRSGHVSYLLQLESHQEQQSVLCGN